MGASLVVAAVMLAPLAAVDPPTAVPSASALIALVVLGLFCTAAAFVFFGVLIAEVGPGRGLVITYVAPVVAVTLGVTVLGERPGAGAVAGLLLILAGSWLSTDGRLPPGLAAVVTRMRHRRGTEPVERRSQAMNAPSTWTRYWTTAEGLRSSFASVPWRR
jgi:drug/metabolite transporter (DMT)-like permease